MKQKKENPNPLEYVERARDLHALNALLRKAGAMKDKREKRKQNKEQKELRSE